MHPDLCATVSKEEGTGLNVVVGQHPWLCLPVNYSYSELNLQDWKKKTSEVGNKRLDKREMMVDLGIKGPCVFSLWAPLE